MDSLKERIFKLYYDKIGTEFPKSIEYLDFVNDVIVYMYELYNDFKIEEILNRNIKRVLPKGEINDICIEVLKSIDPKYSRNFKKYTKENIITPSKEAYSYADNEGIHIFQTNNIEQILVTMHEFIHDIHRISVNEEELIDNLDAWHSSEMFAMIVEFYALFYMNKNNILADEIKKSFLSYIYFMYTKSSKVMGESLILNIIDKYGDLSIKSILNYAKNHHLSDKQIQTINKVDSYKILKSTAGDKMDLTGEYRYAEDYRYIFGFPLAIYIANRMSISDSYKERFVENFANIGEIGSDKFLKKLSAYQIIEDQDCLEWVIGNVKSYTNHIINDDEFNPKMIRFKR